MDVTLLKGYQDLIGKRSAWVGYGNGPTSYSGHEASGGDRLNVPGFQYYIDAVFGAVSVSGLWYVIATPSGVGPRQTWYLKWVYTATGTEATNGTDLSAEVVQIGGFGGTY